jgi:hypothetical protein
MGFFKQLLDGASAGVQYERREVPVRVAKAPPPPRAVDGSWLQWPTIAWGSLHSVAGESYHQHELQQIADARPTGGPAVRLVIAQLVREPENPHDRNAVRVEVGGEHVGYLPRDLAPQSHGLIDSLHQRGQVATCRAEVTGGVPGKPFRGITLHVANPWMPFVEGTPFLDGSRCTSVTVLREERHQGPLERALGTYGGTPFTARLGRGPDDSIGVYVDDDLVGQLSKKMTDRHADALSAAHNAGFPCTCRATVRRDSKNVIQVSLTLLTLSS